MNDNSSELPDIPSVNVGHSSSSLLAKSNATRDAKLFYDNKGNEWENSNLVKKCGRCEATFSMTKRKHHCRECGRVYCHKCSSYKIVVQGQLKRVFILNHSFKYRNLINRN